MFWLLPVISFPIASFAYYLQRVHKKPSQALKDLENQPYVYKEEHGRYGITAVSIGIEEKNIPVFEIRPEDSWSALLKASRLCTEKTTGDKPFDDKAFISCDHPLFVPCLSQRFAARKAVLKLLDMGVKRIISLNGTLWVYITKSPRQFCDPSTVLDIVKTLRRFAGDLAVTPSTVSIPSRSSPTYFGNAVAFCAVSFGLLVAGGLGWFDISMERYRLLNMDLPLMAAGLGLAVGAVWAISILCYFRKSSWGPLLLPYLIFAGGIGWAMIAADGAYYANIEFDKSAPTIQRVYVTSKNITTGRRGSKYYHVYTTPAFDGLYTNLKMNAGALYNYVEQGSAIDVTTGDGYFHFRWVKDERLSNFSNE